MSNQTYAFVRFKNSSREWIYICKEDFYISDIVVVPICDGSCYDIAEIVRIEKLSDDELPIDKQKILSIGDKLNKEEYEKDFYPLTFMRNYINEEYLKEWKLVDENEWCKFYESTFDGQICYEQDWVLTYSLYHYLDENFFEDYTIVNPDNFDITLKFIQTTLTSLHYKKITQEEFFKLIKVVFKS